MKSRWKHKLGKQKITNQKQKVENLKTEMKNKTES
jgi:hypothetical protein